jgi:hypothetical protein
MVGGRSGGRRRGKKIFIGENIMKHDFIGSFEGIENASGGDKGGNHGFSPGN